jgi:hypothetical protein
VEREEDGGGTGGWKGRRVEVRKRGGRERECVGGNKVEQNHVDIMSWVGRRQCDEERKYNRWWLVVTDTLSSSSSGSLFQCRASPTCSSEVSKGILTQIY